MPDQPSLEHIAKTAPALANSRSDINRVIALCGARSDLAALRVSAAAITKARLDILREADAIVRDLCAETGFDDKVWQLPVVLIPLGGPGAPESVILRPINSADGMTADVVLMDGAALHRLTEKLLAIRQVCAVFYDLTHKPPGTIEWE